MPDSACGDRTNACKFVSKNGFVELEVLRLDRRSIDPRDPLARTAEQSGEGKGTSTFVFSVSDTGCGVPIEMQSRIFQARHHRARRQRTFISSSVFCAIAG